MSLYDDLPRTQIKKWNLLIYLLIFFTVMFGGKLVHLASDYFWFKEIGFSAFFNKSLLIKTLLGVSGFAAGWCVLALNLFFANKFSRKPFVIIGPDASISSPFPSMRLFEFIIPILYVVSIAIALFMGSWALGHWETYLKFSASVPFHVADPVFNRDISFYIFTVPFYRFVYRFIALAVFFSTVLSVAVYMINSRIYFSPRGLNVADDAKIHLSILFGTACLLGAAHFQFGMYDLLHAQRTLAPGAGYADIHALLPFLKILRIAAGASAVVLWIFPWYPNSRVVAGSLIFLGAGVFLSRVYATAVQKFEVSPNEIVKETPYLKLAIQNTQSAFGLTGIHELEFDPQENLTLDQLKKNDLTIKNIRLWEHRPLLTSYGQLQEIRTYYDFLDADNDRYFINGEYRQVMLSVRELDPVSLPSRIWINEHLTYTHGYGICMGPVNRISPEGLPEFFIKDIPPVSTIGLKITRPEIYFGESKTGYAIVKSKAKEFDYPAGDENVYTDYQGSGGVPVSNYLRRLLFAARFGELKILFSGDIDSNSRFLYYRSLKERLAKAVPFLKFDPDPYIVVDDEGKLFWMADGYTYSDLYPYSEKVGEINYLRNSVKATVDAYNGTIALYVADEQDPVIQTYAKNFPEMFRPIAQMPAGLRKHVRYPQTLLDIQARVYASYHMTDPQVFYNKEDLWKIPIRNLGGTPDQVDPYYTIMKLAGIGQKEEFILMVPFTPSKKENMIAWMAARCDEPNYGKLLVYNFPKQKLVYGPQQIDSRIDQDAEISKQLTLWDQGGSRVLRGSQLVIPVEQSLLYIQPLYLEASGGGLPELKRVIVAYGNMIAMEENLELALQRIFGGRIDSFTRAENKAAQVLPAVGLEYKSAARQAQAAFEDAQKALKAGDWSGYGREINKLEQLLKGLAEIR